MFKNDENLDKINETIVSEEINKAWQKEPPPIKNDHPAVWDLVLQDIANPKFTHPTQAKIHVMFIEDIKLRDLTGAKKYGVRLQPFNGRNAIKDAYEETVDTVVYLRQAIYEQEKSTLVVTSESDFFKIGLNAVYVVTLDSALKLKFMMEKKKEQDGKSPIDTSKS